MKIAVFSLFIFTLILSSQNDKIEARRLYAPEPIPLPTPMVSIMKNKYYGIRTRVRRRFYSEPTATPTPTNTPTNTPTRTPTRTPTPTHTGGAAEDA